MGGWREGSGGETGQRRARPAPPPPTRPATQSASTPTIGGQLPRTPSAKTSIMLDEPGSFYICTETSPRCYIIQKVSAKNVEKVCEELSGLEVEPEGWENGDPRSASTALSSSVMSPPPLPVLPWWWTPQCGGQLPRTPSAKTSIMLDEPGSFYICTETSPRCYIIQKVSAKNVEKVCEELSGLEVEPEGWENGDPRSASTALSSSVMSPPPLPVLPWWWTPQCERELEEGVCGDLMEEDWSAGPSPDPASLSPPNLPLSELKHRLKLQLQYYFSRENLAGDTYLRSQMDPDLYVPIRTIASFPMIKKLTLDIKLIVQALRSCPNVQVDETGEKVRPSYKRSTLLLREIPEGTTNQEIEALFYGTKCPRYTNVEFAHNQSWYVNFQTDEEAQKAFIHLRTVVQTFKDKPILVRIKTGPAPRPGQAGSDVESDSQSSRPQSLHIPASSGNTNPSPPLPLTTIAPVPTPLPSLLSPNAELWTPGSRASPTPPSAHFDLGFILALNGFQPQGTFRPLMVSVSPSTMHHLAANVNATDSNVTFTHQTPPQTKTHTQPAPPQRNNHNHNRPTTTTAPRRQYQSLLQPTDLLDHNLHRKPWLDNRRTPPPDPYHHHQNNHHHSQAINGAYRRDYQSSSYRSAPRRRYDNGNHSNNKGGRWSPPPPPPTTRRSLIRPSPQPPREPKRRAENTVITNGPSSSNGHSRPSSNKEEKVEKVTSKEKEEKEKKEPVVVETPPPAKFELQTTSFPPLVVTEAPEEKEEEPPTPQWPSLGKRVLTASNRHTNAVKNPKLHKTGGQNQPLKDASSSDKSEEGEQKTSYAAMAKKVSSPPPSVLSGSKDSSRGGDKRSSESSH